MRALCALCLLTFGLRGPHESDDARWEQFVAEHPLPGPGLPAEGDFGGALPPQDHEMQGLAERISVL